MYHCFLAIAVKSGYESKNQECTFTLMYTLIDDGKLDIEKETIDMVALLHEENVDESVIETREHYQYGTELSMKGELYNETFEFAKIFLGKVKRVIEE